MAEGQGFITKVHTPRQTQQPEESFVPQIENATNTKRKDAGSRVCDYCGTTRTPMWRRGPRGKHTLCNACGVKWKDGRIQVPDLELQQQQQIPEQEQKQETQPSLLPSFPYKAEDIHNAALFLQTLDKMHENSQGTVAGGFHNADASSSTAPNPSPTLPTPLYTIYEIAPTKPSLNSPVTNANTNPNPDDMEEDDDEENGSYDNLSLSKVLPKKRLINKKKRPKSNIYDGLLFPYANINIPHSTEQTKSESVLPSTDKKNIKPLERIRSVDDLLINLEERRRLEDEGVIPGTPLMKSNQGFHSYTKSASTSNVLEHPHLSKSGSRESFHNAWTAHTPTKYNSGLDKNVSSDLPSPWQSPNVDSMKISKPFDSSHHETETQRLQTIIENLRIELARRTQDIHNAHQAIAHFQKENHELKTQLASTKESTNLEILTQLHSELMINEEKRRRAECMVLRLSGLLMSKLNINDPNHSSNTWNRNPEDIIEHLASFLTSAPIIDSSDALNNALENQNEAKKSLFANMNVQNSVKDRSFTNFTNITNTTNTNFKKKINLS